MIGAMLAAMESFISILQGLQHCGCKGFVVHAQLYDLAIFNEHGIPLRTNVSQLCSSIQFHVKSFGQFALGICQHPNLVSNTSFFAPSRHHKWIVHRDASYNINTSSFEVGGALQVAWKVFFRTCWCECAWHCEQDAFLTLEELQDIHSVSWFAFIDLNGRQHVSL